MQVPMSIERRSQQLSTTDPSRLMQYEGLLLAHDFYQLTQFRLLSIHEDAIAIDTGGDPGTGQNGEDEQDDTQSDFPRANASATCAH